MSSIVVAAVRLSTGIDERVERVDVVTAVVGDEHEVGLVPRHGLGVELVRRELGRRHVLGVVGRAVHGLHLVAGADREHHLRRGRGHRHDLLGSFVDRDGSVRGLDRDGELGFGRLRPRWRWRRRSGRVGHRRRRTRRWRASRTGARQGSLDVLVGWARFSSCRSRDGESLDDRGHLPLEPGPFLEGWFVSRCGQATWLAPERRGLTVAGQRRLVPDFASRTRDAGTVAPSRSRRRVFRGSRGVLVGDARGVEGRHLTEHARCGLHQRERETRARPLAEAKVEVEQWHEIEVVERGARAGFGRAVARDGARGNPWCGFGRDQQRGVGDEAVDDDRYAARRRHRR